MSPDSIFILLTGLYPQEDDGLIGFLIYPLLVDLNWLSIWIMLGTPATNKISTYLSIAKLNLSAVLPLHCLDNLLFHRNKHPSTQVRRLLLMLLLVLFSLQALTPLLASASRGRSSIVDLPVCCRRGGQHQCSMSKAEQVQYFARAHQWSVPPVNCPFHGPLFAPAQSNPFTPAVRASSLYSDVPSSHSCGIAQAESQLRIARERSRYKRGPPLLS